MSYPPTSLSPSFLPFLSLSLVAPHGSPSLYRDHLLHPFFVLVSIPTPEKPWMRPAASRCMSMATSPPHASCPPMLFCPTPLPLLYCAAVFLEMTEVVCPGNLLDDGRWVRKDLDLQATCSATTTPARGKKKPPSGRPTRLARAVVGACLGGLRAVAPTRSRLQGGGLCAARGGQDCEGGGTEAPAGKSAWVRGRPRGGKREETSLRLRVQGSWMEGKRERGKTLRGSRAE